MRLAGCALFADAGGLCAPLVHRVVLLIGEFDGAHGSAIFAQSRRMGVRRRHQHVSLLTSRESCSLAAGFAQVQRVFRGRSGAEKKTSKIMGCQDPVARRLARRGLACGVWVGELACGREEAVRHLNLGATGSGSGCWLGGSSIAISLHLLLK